MYLAALQAYFIDRQIHARQKKQKSSTEDAAFNSN